MSATGDRRDAERELLATTGTQARRTAFGPGGGAAMPVERSEDFGATLKRLGTILGSETHRLIGVLVLTVSSVVLVVLGPRLLGQATDIIVDGVVGGEGVDFDALHRKLLVVAAIYLGSWALSASQAYILAGVVQRSMYSLRESVELKITRHDRLIADDGPYARLYRAQYAGLAT